MEKPDVQPKADGYVVSDGVTTPSNVKDWEEQFGIIPPGMSIAEWEAMQLADRSQKTDQK